MEIQIETDNEQQHTVNKILIPELFNIYSPMIYWQIGLYISYVCRVYHFLRCLIYIVVNSRHPVLEFSPSLMCATELWLSQREYDAIISNDSVNLNREVRQILY